MSAIAALYNVPSTRAELDQWAFAHQSHHRDICRKIFASTGQNLIQSILDPINPNDNGVWLYQHQQMHDQFEPILGIAGYDLLDVEWQDPNQLAGWILLNAQTHLQASITLGIG